MQLQQIGKLKVSSKFIKLYLVQNLSSIGNQQVWLTFISPHLLWTNKINCQVYTKKQIIDSNEKNKCSAEDSFA